MAGLGRSGWPGPQLDRDAGRAEVWPQYPEGSALVVVEQAREIDRLALEVKMLREHALAAEDAPKNERPPHY